MAILSLGACTPGAPRGPSTGGGTGGGGCTAPAPGECPNACAGGTHFLGQSCKNTGECVCGLFCPPDGACIPYAGQFAGCACPGDPDKPDAGPIEPDTSVVMDVAVPEPDVDDAMDAIGEVSIGFGDAKDTTEPPDVTPDPGPTPIVDITDCEKQPPQGALCNPYCNLGCAPDKHCTYVGQGKFGCETPGDTVAGGTCSTFADCGLGTACFGITGEPSATCHLMCKNDSQCPGPCDLTVNFGSGTLVDVCNDPILSCNPFSQDCEQGACYLSGPGTDCLVDGAAGDAEPCWGLPSNFCKPGLVCGVECTQPCSTNDLTEDQPKCSACPTGAAVVLSPAADVGTCVSSDVPQVCDLFQQTGCSPGDACYVVGGGWACLSAGTTPLNGACVFTDACVPGTVCVNGTCRRVCRKSDTGLEQYRCAAHCPDTVEILAPAEWDTGVCP